MLTIAVALAFFVWQGRLQAVAALYGGAIVLLNSLLLARRVRGAGELDGRGAALALYAGAVQRFVVTLAAFGIGMGLLRLPPLPQILAFAVAQLGFAIAAGRQQP